VDQSVAVGAVIATIGEPGEAVSAPAAAAVATVATAAVAAPARPPATSVRVKASPLARRIAAALGIDLATLVGSGPNGRVIRADVERHAGRRPTSLAAGAAAADGSPQAAGSPSDGGTPDALTHLPLSRLQQTIARRMVESRTSIPDFELRREIDMSNVVALREQLRGVTDPPPSYNDFIVRAAALVLRELPRVNASYAGDALEIHSRVNVGIAVAAEGALAVPTIFDADRLPLASLRRGCAIARSRPPSCRAAPSRSPTWACSALTASRP
jgi:pyruvate dehydrogenase E2 component (dihydrolipoamide acetyltransferase)